MYTGHDHYRINQLRREDIIRAARREHLLRQAQEKSPKTHYAYLAALLALLNSVIR
ncbi:MAG: hypothetical protein IAE89_08750 [Anaerolineae bacterium]|nr:hypothetical protein [Anaerolineae bacterium]